MTLTPHLQRDGVTVYHGDCLDVLRELPDASVDSVVTDPPYGLEFMGKDWDAPWKSSSVGRGVRVESERADEMTKAGKGHATSAGPYLAARVDSVRVAGLPFQQWCELWAAECLRVLKPGGHLLAFGGSRTWHRLAAAVEDAGFEIRDSIAWLYGSGFPKSLDVSKAIDRMDAGDERRRRNLAFTEWMRSTGITSRQIDAATSSFMGSHYLTAREQAAVPTSDMFDLIRPLLAVEVPEWVEGLVRERTVESENYKAREVLATERRANEPSGIVGIGQGERVMFDRQITAAHTEAARAWQGWGTALKPAFEPVVVGRKPLAGTVAANVLEHGTGALNIDACRVGNESTKRMKRGGANDFPHEDDSWTPRDVQAGSDAGRWPANVVLDESQAAALDEQSGTLTSGKMRAGTARANRDGWSGPMPTETANDTPGDQGGASRFFYVAKADASERPRVNGTAHPTVKPLALMRWLVRLVTPPGGTVLEPFAGSGTTVEACLLEKVQCVAIEREADYLPLIESRLARRRDPVRAIKLAAADEGLFAFGDDEEAS